MSIKISLREPWDDVPDPGPRPEEPASWDAGAIALHEAWLRAARRYHLAKSIRDLAADASVASDDEYHFRTPGDQATFVIGRMILSGDLGEGSGVASGIFRDSRRGEEGGHE